MIPPFDIVNVVGGPIWVETVHTHDEGRDRVRELIKSHAYEY